MLSRLFEEIEKASETINFRGFFINCVISYFTTTIFLVSVNSLVLKV